MSLVEFFTQYPAGWIASAFVLGALIGSFLNVVIYRYPLMLKREWENQCVTFINETNRFTLKPLNASADTSQSKFNLITPNSHCPQCKKPVAAYDNIPLLSYVLLRGRCRQCKTTIPLRYPLVELVTALLTAYTAARFGVSYLSLALAVLVWGLVALTMIDYDHKLLPDIITYPLLWLALLFSATTLSPWVSPAQSIIGATCGYLILWTVFHAFRLLTGKHGMGHGDFKLLAVFGAWLGIKFLPIIIVLSSLVGALVGIALILFRGHDRNNPIPFGPYLAAAGLITIFWGQELLNTYTRIVGL